MTQARITTRMTEGEARLALFAWASPAFPVGSFAFSHGLEWAIEAGDILGAHDLERWLTDLIGNGALRSDAVLASLVHRAPDQFAALNELALALTPSAERRLETTAQGNAFLVAVAAAWPIPALLRFAATAEGEDVAYPLAFGVAAALHNIPLAPMLEVLLAAALGNLVSGALRLGAIGQTDGQAIVARLTPALLRCAREAESATLDELGTCAWQSDIAAMRHEEQYSRLFRS